MNKMKKITYEVLGIKKKGKKGVWTSFLKEIFLENEMNFLKKSLF